MAHDPLQTMLRLRQRAVDAARINLVKAVSAETEADKRARDAEHSIETEADRAADPDGGDDLIDCFAAWLPEARRRAKQARTEQERRGVEVARKRAELTASRTGLETIETLLRQRRDKLATEELRKMQRVIDEAGSRKRPPNR